MGNTLDTFILLSDENISNFLKKLSKFQLFLASLDLLDEFENSFKIIFDKLIIAFKEKSLVLSNWAKKEDYELIKILVKNKEEWKRISEVLDADKIKDQLIEAWLKEVQEDPEKLVKFLKALKIEEPDSFFKIIKTIKEKATDLASWIRETAPDIFG